MEGESGGEHAGNPRKTSEGGFKTSFSTCRFRKTKGLATTRGRDFREPRDEKCVSRFFPKLNGDRGKISYHTKSCGSIENSQKCARTTHFETARGLLPQ